MEHSWTNSVSLAVGALAAWRLSDRSPVRRTPSHYIWGAAEKMLQQAVTRAVSPADIAFLRSQPWAGRDLERYLRASRKTFLRTYLRQMRANFDRNSAIVRQFAADTDAPDLAFTALRESVKFYTLWLVLRTSLACNLVGPAWRLTEKLLSRGLPSDYQETPDHAQTARS